MNGHYSIIPYKFLRIFSFSTLLLLATAVLTYPAEYPAGFSVYPGCLKPLLGSWEDGEPESYSVNLARCNFDLESAVEQDGRISTPHTDDGFIGYKYLGNTSGGIHAVQVWENGGGTLTMLTVLLLRMDHHTVLDEQDDAVAATEKEVLTSLGQIWLFGEGAYAALEENTLTYRSQEKTATLDLGILPDEGSGERDEDSGEEGLDDLITTADMLEYAVSHFEEADKELNRVYAQLMETLDDEGKEKLRKAQRAWVAFRDSNAEFSADVVRGGTLAPVLHANTLYEMTKARVKELKDSVFEP